MVETFINFLKTEGIYNQYKAYALDYKMTVMYDMLGDAARRAHPTDFDEILNVIIDYLGSEKLVSSPFQFSKTKEGADYWIDIHFKWMDLLNDLN